MKNGCHVHSAITASLHKCYQFASCLHQVYLSYISARTLLKFLDVGMQCMSYGYYCVVIFWMGLTSQLRLSGSENEFYVY